MSPHQIRYKTRHRLFSSAIMETLEEKSGCPLAPAVVGPPLDLDIYRNFERSYALEELQRVAEFRPDARDSHTRGRAAALG